MKKIYKTFILLSSFVLASCASGQSSVSSSSIAPKYIVHNVSIDGVGHKVLDGEKAPLLSKEDTEDTIFSGWKVGEEIFDPETPIHSDLIINSYFRERVMYSVYFDDVETIVKEGYCAKKPEDPVKPGMVFDGWYEGLIKFDFSTPIITTHHLVSWFNPEHIDYSSLKYTDLGSLGGTQANEWSIGVNRNDDFICFKYTTETELDLHYGIDLFLQLGSATYSSRNQLSYCITIKESGLFSIYNYPNNTKKSIYSSEHYKCLFGMELRYEYKDDKNNFYLVLPNDSLSALAGKNNFISSSNIGVALNSVNYYNGAYDVYCNENLLGFNGKPEVSRTDPRDYLRISPTGALFDSIHN